MQKKILLSLLFCAFIFNVFAQNSAQTHTKKFVFTFRHNSDLLLKEYRDNTEQLGSLINLWESSSVYSIDSVIIVGSASPNEASDANRQLSSKRANSLWGYLVYRLPSIKNISKKLIVNTSSWQEIIDDIKADPLMPNSEYVTKTLAFYGNNPHGLERIKQEHPDSYAYLYNKIIPYRRNASACIVFYTAKIKPALEISPKTETQAETQAETQTETQAETQTETQAEATIEVITSPEPLVVEEPLPVQLVDDTYICKPLFALKTNLLFDVASMLNIELEVPLGNRFSLAGEFIFSWWLWEKEQRCLQLLSGNMEGRYWFSAPGPRVNRPNRKPMTGWFIGLYLGGGYYDLEWDKKGYQGEFFIAAGVSAGFVHPIGRNLRMEYSLGLGYMQTRYRTYEAQMDDKEQWHLYQTNTGQFTWLGPTRAKISLVWMLNHNIKQGGKRR